jgi:hypothetical protein
MSTVDKNGIQLNPGDYFKYAGDSGGWQVAIYCFEINSGLLHYRSPKGYMGAINPDYIIKISNEEATFLRLQYPYEW